MLNNEILETKSSRMVHDVRTPLTILNMLYTTFSAKMEHIPEAKEELDIMKEEIAKIDAIVTKYREELRKEFN